MVPPELTIELLNHLRSQGYTFINLPDTPEDGPADAAIVTQKGRVRTLFLVALCDAEHSYYATPAEAVEQYVLMKQQYAAHIEVIRVAGLPWVITYPQSIENGGER